MSNRAYNKTTDVPWRPAGAGLAMTWRCIGCNQPRGSTLGSKGAGVMKRCKPCVEKKQKGPQS